MSAISDRCGWGWGFGLRQSPEGRTGARSRGGAGYASGLDDSEQELLEGISGDLATEKPPLVEEHFPGPIAQEMYWDDATVVVIQGPVGSGKTTTVLKSRLRRAKMIPRSVLLETLHGITGHWRFYKLLVTRETYRVLWSTTIPDFLKVFPKHLGEWVGGRGGPVTFTMIFEDEHGPIEFVAEFMAFGDDIVNNLRGYQVTDIWLHEMDTNPEDVLANGITRIGRHPGQNHFAGYPPHMREFKQIVGDMNAPDEDNYTYGLLHDEAKRKSILEALNLELPEGSKPIEVKFYRQPGYGEDGCENMHNLPPTYYQTQIAVLKLAGKGDHVKRLVYNQVTFLREGQPVFEDEFNPTVHVSGAKLQPWDGFDLRIGLDQGFKAAAVIGQFRSPYHWQILAELHFPKERLTAVEFGRRLRDLLDTDPRFSGRRVEGGWADMAGEQGASQAADENFTWNMLAAKAAQITVRPQKIGTNQINPRLEAVRAALEFLQRGQTGLLIDPTCKLLRRGFEARYVWKDEVDKNGDKRKRPDKSKTEANVMDALQYLLLSEALPHGLTPITAPAARPGSLSPAALHNTSLPGFGGPGSGGGIRTDYDILDPYQQ